MKYSILIPLCSVFAGIDLAHGADADSRWTFSSSVGYFYDGNVTESVVYNGNGGSSDPGASGGSGGGGGPGGGSGGGGGKGFNPPSGRPVAAGSVVSAPAFSTLGGPGGPGGGNGNNQGQQIGKNFTAPVAIIYNDSGQKADASLGYKVFVSGPHSVSLYAEASATFYQTYTDYNYSGYTGDIRYHYNGESLDFTSTFSYITTYYAGQYSQDYLRWEPGFEWKTLTPNVEWLFTFNQDSRTNTKVYYVSTTGRVSWFVDSTTYRLGFTPTYGSGDPAVFTPAPLAVSSGNEFSRYTSYSVFAEYGYDWTQSLSNYLRISYTVTNYAQEALPQTLPPGVLGSARVDNNTYVSLDTRYQLAPQHWSSTLSLTYTQNAATGFQGVPSSLGAPSATYNRPMTTLTIAYDF